MLLVVSLQDAPGVPFEIPDSEWVRLLEFADAVEHLEGADLFRKKRTIKFSARDSEAGEDLSEVPPTIEIEQVLHRLRPILLDKERSNCLAIISALKRRIEQPDVRALLDRLKALYIHRPERMTWLLQRDGVVLNSDDFLTTWINGLEYHRDPKRRWEFEELHGFPITKAALAALLGVVVTKAQVAFTVAGLIRAMEKGQGTRHGFGFCAASDVS